jgi:murein DD-endopeptidase MepM/ murein hydrolase activator NlpD
VPKFESEIEGGDKGSLIERFLKVNRDLREKNYRQMVQVTTSSEKELLWKGAFLRLPNSEPRAGFADTRDYIYQGRKVDQQVHLGIDLAAVAHTPVPAANKGKVAFAGDLGIYGRTILIDHGFGVFSMYSHLSDYTVQVGQTAEKGEIIGHTGDTGLAGGDHLHFSMVVHDTFVSPVEWWDPMWIEKRIMDKLKGTENG